MNKQFIYNGYNFNIKVEFNTLVEKKLNGKRLHTITLNCTDAWNYYEKRNVNSEDLITAISSMENKAKEQVDLILDLNDDKSELENQLIQLGFTY